MNSRFIRFLSIYISSIFLFSYCNKDNINDKSLQQIKARGYFIAGIDDQFPPMSFRSIDTNEITGFDIDITKEAGRRLGLAVQFKPVSWDNIISGLNKGEIDIILSGQAVTEEREQIIEFSQPYLKNRQIIMVSIDSSISTLNMLKDKKLGLRSGSSSEAALNNYPKIIKQLKELKKYSNNTPALADLASKKIDAVVIDEISGRWNMARKPGVYKELNDDPGRELYCISFRKNDTTFRDAFDKVLDDIKKDKKGDEISKKWFGEFILIK